VSTRPTDRKGTQGDGRRVMSPYEERRAEFKRYKQDVKERGKPFYPFAMFHDTVMSLVVVSVIVGLAVIWKYTADEVPNDSGWLGPLYKDKADPGTTSFVPRPDWYFYFLFYLLRIFKWPESVLLGTVGLVTICIVLLLAIPFVDTRRERRPERRPVAMVALILTVISMGVLTYKGATAAEAVPSELAAEVPKWIQEENLLANARQVQGLPAGSNPDQLVRDGVQLFSEAGCLNCHVYLGSGSSNLGAPDLTAEGAKNKGIQFQIDHLRCPQCVNSGSQMPAFAQLGDDNLLALAVFLESSKGKQ
jgi:quinol---cytochrome c reductase cytochrome c subunit, bacillus type